MGIPGTPYGFEERTGGAAEAMARNARVVAPGASRTISPTRGTGGTAAEMSMVSPEFRVQDNAPLVR